MTQNANYDRTRNMLDLNRYMWPEPLQGLIFQDQVSFQRRCFFRHDYLFIYKAVGEEKEYSLSTLADAVF